MIKKFTIYNLQFTIVFIFALYIVHSTFYIPFAYAQAACPAQPDARVRDGLISTPDIDQSNNNFSNASGTCVTTDKAAFVPYKVPAYNDLKSLYFDQSKSTRKSTISPASGDEANQGDITSSIGNTDADRLIFVDGSLRITGNGFLNSKPNIPIVIFVRGNLTFDNLTLLDFSHSFDTGGLVFVVGGNVIIDQTVRQIDAVIISSGTIYTAGDGCTTSSTEAGTDNLLIYGSLISLEGGSINFCRDLTDDSSIPAERIIHQPKYLVILRNLFSDTLQKWEEIQ